MLSLLFIYPSQLYAYTVEDVSSHNTDDDCWMTYDNGVYDLTEYLEDHEKYMDISSWCGEDMTEDFETKDGTGRDHKSSSYALLEEFKIGDIEKNSVTTTDSVIEDNPSTTSNIETDDTKEENLNPYNVIVPLLLTSFLYWGSYYVYGKSHIKKFNGFWNTILLLTLVVPSFGFGIFMILRYSFSNLWNIDFDFMYWHVELSLFMGILGISHLIQRWKLYILQLKGK